MSINNVNWNDPSLYKNVDWSKVDYSGGAGKKATPAVDAAQPPAPGVVAPVTSDFGLTTPATGGSVTNNPQMGGAVQQVLNQPAMPVGVAASGTHDAQGYSTAGFGGRTQSQKTGDVNSYKGNVGQPYGSNMQILPAGTDPSTYKYTNNFANTTDQDQTVYVWNKYGKDGKPFTGQSDLANALAVHIPAHSSVNVAFDEDSQVAWAKDTGVRSNDGSIKGTWGEADFGNVSNGAHSGYDVNTAPGNNGFMQISSNGAQPDQSTTGLHWSETTQADNSIVPGSVRLNTTLGS